MYEMIKRQLSSTVPFAAHTGIEVLDVAEGLGAAQLKQTEQSINHVGTQHAGALFTLGETASGAAMAGTFAPVLMGVRPLAGSADISFEKIAKGTITARARTGRSGSALLEELETNGKVRFPVEVELTDEAGNRVAEMTVEWSVAKS